MYSSNDISLMGEIQFAFRLSSPSRALRNGDQPFEVHDSVDNTNEDVSTSFRVIHYLVSAFRLRQSSYFILGGNVGHIIFIFGEVALCVARGK